MAIEYEELAQGLRIRKDTPKQTVITQDFVQKLTKGSDPRVFKDTIQEIAKPISDD